MRRPSQDLLPDETADAAKHRGQSASAWRDLLGAFNLRLVVLLVSISFYGPRLGLKKLHACSSSCGTAWVRGWLLIAMPFWVLLACVAFVAWSRNRPSFWRWPKRARH